MNGGEVLVQTLLSRGVDTAFFVAGGTFITVMEAMSRVSNQLRAVPVRLESSRVPLARPTPLSVSTTPCRLRDRW